ncbi:unnamed protein product [Rhizophagus irregularis]|uniref:Uncharacterized protein n=1 Tax=Rhizophagus irregularis TaxID=588596 RepID=A0A915ZC74_9GLOM|nr:unnamed protein product [Rhizophagus irregularis]CAB5371014.1 unnamed protein product [Rhizophagus irregularis]
MGVGVFVVNEINLMHRINFHENIIQYFGITIQVQITSLFLNDSRLDYIINTQIIKRSDKITKIIQIKNIYFVTVII